MSCPYLKQSMRLVDYREGTGKVPQPVFTCECGRDPEDALPIGWVSKCQAANGSCWLWRQRYGDKPDPAFPQDKS
jgi:hypothetical protein